MNRYVNPDNKVSMPGYKLPTPYKKPLRRNANIIGFGLLVLLFIPYLLNFIFVATQPLWLDLYLQNEAVGEQVMSIIYYLIAFIISIAIISALLQIPAKVAFPFRRAELDITIASIGISRGTILVGSFLTALVYNAVINLTGYAPTSPDFSSPRGLTANILHFISVAILPAILEELLFRGVIMQSLRRFGDSFALIISSVLFGVIHGNLIQAPYSILMGLVMGYFILYTGSIWPGIIIHFINNGFSVVQDWIGKSTTVAQDNMIYNLTLIFAILLSVISLVYLKKRMGSVFYVPPSKYPLDEKEKYITFISAATIILVCIASIYFFTSNLELFEQVDVGPEALIIGIR